MIEQPPSSAFRLAMVEAGFRRTTLAEVLEDDQLTGWIERAMKFVGR